MEAVRYTAEVLKGNEDARRWAEAIPGADLDDLVQQFARDPGA